MRKGVDVSQQFVTHISKFRPQQNEPPPSPTQNKTSQGANDTALIPPKVFNTFLDLQSTITLYDSKELEEGPSWRRHFTPAESKRYSRIKLLGKKIDDLNSSCILPDIEHLFFTPGAVPPSLSKLDSIRSDLNEQ